MASYISLILGCILVNNFVLTQILGICPFLGVSKSVKTASGMGGAVIFVMTLAGLVTACIHKFLLLPFGIEYMNTIVFILVIAGIVQIVEILLQRFSQPLYKALGIYLPLITTNCAVLGAAILCTQKNFTLVKSTVYCLASGIGFALALILFSSIRERLDLARPPKVLKGLPLTLITAGLLAMAFMGFSGLGN
jgi:electron transport complex protein RnfA